MVTASEGSPSLVTSSPFTATSTAPSSRQSGMIVSSARPPSHSLPITALLRPTMLATDRSISPVTTISVSGRAISAMTTRSSSRNPRFRVLAKPSTLNEAITRKRTRKVVMTLPGGRVNPRGAGAGGGVAFPATGAEAVSAATEVPPSETGGQAQGQRPVQDDRGEDQRADRGVPPEGVEAQLGECGADRGEQQGAERRAPGTAGATGDGHATDDARGHDVELQAGSRGGVQGLEPGGVEDAGQPGQRAVDDEGGQHPPAHRDPGEPGGLRRGADAV